MLLGGGAAFLREMTDDSIRTSEVGEAGCPAPANPRVGPGQSREPIINLPFGKPQVMAPWTIQVSIGHHLGNRWI